jgi:capsular exopolysaccharide synthesis family protein
MERIKQALEKAREDRQRTGMPAAFGPKATALPVTQITYSQTRRQEVQQDVLRERRVVTARETGASADAYRMLRTQVLQRLNENNWNALAITSPGGSEGKTLTAINLAISLAQEVTCTVLLVDANLRDSGVHAYFGLKREKGLSDYLTGDIPLSELLINPAGIERFVILPGGTPLANSGEMLNSPKMKQLVEELKERYRSRIIIFDLPPVLSSADALAFSPYVDAALLVIEEGKSPAEEIQRAAELLQNTRLIGTVLNKSRTAARNPQDTEVWLEQKLQGLFENRFIRRTREKLSGLARRIRRGKN